MPMRNVVLDRETVEKVREALDASEALAIWVPEISIARQYTQKIVALRAALDAALATPEPFERLKDGDIVVKNGPSGDIEMSNTLWVRHLVITKRGEFAGSTFIPKDRTRAVALALLELATGPTP